MSLHLWHWKNKDNDFLCQLCFLSLQWNILTPDILYRRHLSTTDFFLRNEWNDAQTLITRPLCSRHFIANTSLQWTSFLVRSQITLSPRTNFLIADHIQYKTFLARNVYRFYFWQCFTLSFKFPLIFVILLFSLMAFSSIYIKMYSQYFHENGFPVCIHLSGWYDFQLQRCPKCNGTAIEIWIQ